MSEVILMSEEVHVSEDQFISDVSVLNETIYTMDESER